MSKRMFLINANAQLNLKLLDDVYHRLFLNQNKKQKTGQT